MNTPPREEDLFQAVIQLAVAERTAFLDRQCGENQALRARVEALLAAYEHPVEMLADRTAPALPTLVVTPSDLRDEAVGQIIGRYKLLEKVGEGGCGVVYVAEQTEPLRRRVALKVIKLGMDTKQVVARFEAERQALALMDHPNIAKVLDAGSTETGLPYFVMELVRGIRITDYCDQHKLGTRARLDLFIKVCQAIQHAHQKGIIHRDIKPSNILVTLHDGVPVPKVIDFGIAKATEGRLTDAAVYTQLTQLVGTPAYMSPEQAEMSGLDIDTRSDIYSLGVLLYELLTGATPLDAEELMASGLDTMRKTIREKEPPRPSTRLTRELIAVAGHPRSREDGTGLAIPTEEELAEEARQRQRLKEQIARVRGDLDWIVMKCLEKDRTRRYETANGLAMDLKRHLANEPVLARPPSAAYRLQKAFRRNRTVFAGVSAVLAGLVVAVVALAFAWGRERELRIAQRDQVEARLSAETEAAQAQAIAGFVVGLLDRSVDTMNRQGNTRGIRSLLEAADALTAAQLTNAPAAELTVRATVWRYYARILNEHRAAARQGDRIRELLTSQPPRALDLPAVTPATVAGHPIPIRDYLRLHTLGSRLWAGDTDWARNELRILRSEFLRQNPPATNSLAIALSTEGFCLHMMDRDAEAEPLLKEAFSLAPASTGYFMSDQAGLTYAHVLSGLGRQEEAQRVVRESIRWMSPATSISALNCYALLVESLCQEGRYAAADNVVKELLEQARAQRVPAEELLPVRLLGWAVQANSGQWREAAQAFATAAASDSTAPAVWRLGAAAALATDDPAVYARLCQNARWRFGATAESDAALFLTMGLLLRPLDEEGLFAVDQLVARLEHAKDEHWSGAFHSLIGALFAYRSGNPAEALKQLNLWEASRDPLPVRAALLRDEKASPAPCFWRALILCDLGRPVEAAAAFREGDWRLKSGILPGWDLLQATASLYVAHALRAEAVQVLRSKGAGEFNPDP